MLASVAGRLQRELIDMARKVIGNGDQRAFRPNYYEMERELSEAISEPFVSTQLKAKAELYEQRHAVYGDNYKRFGPIFSLLMETQSLNVKSKQDMSRLGVLIQLISKVTRYCENFNRGGHTDSLDDIAVYAMMLKELDHDG